MSPQRRRVAIIGAGGIASGAHVPALQAESDRVELVAVLDVDAGRARDFCERFGIPRSYIDVDALLADEKPDLVHICTPPSTHADLAVSCLRASAWVYLEKPPCLSLAEYDRIAEAEGASGPYASVVFQQRFGAAGQHAIDLVRSGELGRPLVAVGNTTWYRPPSYFEVPWRGKWETEGGGPTMGHGIHQMDLLLALLGEWDEVTAMVGRLDRHVQTEDVSAAVVRFASGTVATVMNSVLSPRQESYVRIDCVDATVELTHLYRYGNDSWRYTPAPHVTDEERISRWRTPSGDEPSSHGAQLRRLLDSMDRGERPAMSGQAGRETLELVTGIYQSALTGRPVQRGEITPESRFYQRLHGDTPGWAP